MTMNAGEVICIRCCEADAADDQGYCGHCHWAVLVEVEDGVTLLEEYLAKWAGFADWCLDHGQAA